MNMLKIKVQTLFALGLTNLVRVFWYRFSVKIGLNSVRKLKAQAVSGPFFRKSEHIKLYNFEPNLQWIERQAYFGWYFVEGREIPKWDQNVFTGVLSAQKSLPWWEISDFNSDIGDIKAVWEASRFDWVICFAQQILLGKVEYLEKLNQWVEDWGEKNPPYLGENWKCGQETSIRVIHLAMAALLLEQIQSPLPALLAFIEIHLQRIAPTMMYAIAQDNNHGTSEAAALYIGGSWLMCHQYPKGQKWYEQGKTWLENRIGELIENDGSFSQYSTNYHRLMLDTCSLVEIWRRRNGLDAFSDEFSSSLQAAVKWLLIMIRKNGDVPNLGANDGAYILNLGSERYRDFRPSTQLAATLFYNKCAWTNKGSWNSSLKWFGIKIPDNKVSFTNEVQTFDNGGYHVLQRNELFVLLRYPRFRFRPSQSDILHLDFWQGEKNLLRDSGTFSYNSDSTEADLSSVAAHNTVQFDGREQMPRLSRFLWGGWPKGESISAFKKGEFLFCSAGYTDYKGASHYREVFLTKNSLRIIDKLKGFIHDAVLRWHLYPTEWHILGNTVQSSMGGSIYFFADTPFKVAIRPAFESRYYYKKTKVPVLELVVQDECTVTTLYQLPR